MLKERYNIPMHSFVDLITNSSTEVYIEATEHTIKSVAALVDNILALGGSKLTCDDLFTIELNQEQLAESGNDYGYRTVGLVVKCRDKNSELGNKTAAVLADLTAMFNIESCHDG